MSSSAVAVINIRSADITAIVAEKGVNDTFVFKGSASLNYDGYVDGVFSDADAFVKSVTAALEKAIYNCGEKISEVYVGVPSEFLSLHVKDGFIGFSGKRKIEEMDVDSFFEKNLPPDSYSNKTLIRSACAYYVLSDKRRVLDPIGYSTSSLSGLASYIFCSDYFIRLVQEGISAAGKYSVEFIPSTYAQAIYLIPVESRSSGAALIDFGMCSTEIAVVYGNALTAMISIPMGEANIMYAVAEKYRLRTYDHISSVLTHSNLYIKSPNQIIPIDDFPLEIKYADVNEIIGQILGALCEQIYNFLDRNENKFSGGVHGLYATGESIIGIRGALEKITYLLSMVVEVAKPDLPYYNKPRDSSALSLISYAYRYRDQFRNKNSLLYKFLKKFGG